VICSNCRSAIATHRYAYVAGTVRIAPLCDPCHAALSAIGMDLREERRSVERDTRPEWLKRSLAKVLDHGGIA